MSLVVGTNAYEDAAAGDVYFTDRINGANWLASSTALKEQALVSATSWLDRQLWVEEQTAPKPGQALDWPRTGVIDEEGNAVDSGSVPQFIIDGTFELALSLIDDPTIQESRSATSDNVKKVKGGSAEIEFFFDSSTVSGTTFPQIVMELIAFYLLNSGSITSPFASGLDNVSGIQDFGLTRGY